MSQAISCTLSHGKDESCSCFAGLLVGKKEKKNESLLNPCAYSHSESRTMFILKWVATRSLVSSADLAADYCTVTCTSWGQDSRAQEIPAWLGFLMYGVTTDASDNSLLAFVVFQASKIGGTA